MNKLTKVIWTLFQPCREDDHEGCAADLITKRCNCECHQTPEGCPKCHEAWIVHNDDGSCVQDDVLDAALDVVDMWLVT